MGPDAMEQHVRLGGKIFAFSMLDEWTTTGRKVPKRRLLLISTKQSRQDLPPSPKVIIASVGLKSNSCM
jgi:hypothetical protein